MTKVMAAMPGLGWEAGEEESEVLRQAAIMWHSDELKESKNRYTRETVKEMEKWRKECVLWRKEQEQAEVASVVGKEGGQSTREEEQGRREGRKGVSGGQGVKRKEEAYESSSKTTKKVKTVSWSDGGDAGNGEVKAEEVEASKEEEEVVTGEAKAGEKKPPIKKKKIGKKMKLELKTEKKQKFERAMNDVLSGKIPNIRKAAKVNGLHPSSLRGCLDNRLLGKLAKHNSSSNLIKFSCGYTKET